MYVDCLARENKICRAEDFVQKILSIASGLRDDGECPELHLSALRFPDLDIPRPPVMPYDSVDQLIPFPENHYDRESRPQTVDITAEHPLLPTYGSGGFKQQEDEAEEMMDYGHLFDNFDEMMLADGDMMGSSSSSYISQDYSPKFAKSKHNTFKDGEAVADARTVRTEGPKRSTNAVELYNNDVTTSAYDQEQLQHYQQKELSKVDPLAESATTSRYSTTTEGEAAISPRLRPHHRHGHQQRTSRTESTEQVARLHLRQARSSTTTKSKLIL